MNEQRTQMMQMATGYWLSKALYCAARAGVADALASGPRPVPDLAASANVQEESLYRVLRALASVGVFRETAPGVFDLTESAAYLRADHPETMKHFALMVGDDLFEAWSELYHTLETGESAVAKRFGGDFFAKLAKDPDKTRMFDHAMQEIHGIETGMMLDHFDFSRFRRVLDVGGGNGSTLLGILEAHPALGGQLFELPHVIEDAREHVTASKAGDRVELLPGSFFEEVPGDADCIILRHVLHDWSDEECETILKNSRRALADGGSLLIVEKVITPGNEPDFAKLLDLNMMAIGGKERTEAQYQDLLERAGLRLQGIHVLPGPTDIVEAKA